MSARTKSLSHGLVAMAVLITALALAACQRGEPGAETPATTQTAVEEPAMAAMDPGDENILLAEWTGPYGGLPAFGDMHLEDLEPAMEVAMAEELAEIDRIANNPEPPTFANTIEAKERAGRTLDRVEEYYGLWRSNLSTPEFRDIQQEISPRLAEHKAKIFQNGALFDRIRAVYESGEMQSLRSDQQRLVSLMYEEFVRKGSTLSDADKARYARITQRLAELQTLFSNNVLADEEGYVVYLAENQLSGLPDAYVESAAAAAAERGQEGRYAVTNTRSSMDPFLTFSDERDLREQVWRNFYSRGDNGDEHDNNAIITEILTLRLERAKLVGFDNFAEWQLANRMAKKPERAFELMQAVWPAAVARVHEEVADMQAIADGEGAAITIEPWDYRYYAEKVRQARYDFDSDEVKQYLQLDKLREAMFFVAGELFDFAFRPLPQGEVPVFHPDVKVWEVTRKSTGDLVGLWYLDPYARPGKRSGAWATAYRGHESFDGETTVLASNNSNFVKGTPGEPALISWDDAETLFHEFGHALHGLSSNVAYPYLNNGVRDYTEFHSQLLERWLLTDPVIDKYLVHVKTGEPIPADLVAKLKRAKNFNQGFRTTEYLASALMDMYYHTIDPTGLDPDAFEREKLAELGMPKELPMRHRSPQFGHIFSQESYAAGYYGYLWADALTADAAEAFEVAPGGYYDKDLAASLVKNLFAPRNAVDPEAAYRTFRGRDADKNALLRDRGFAASGESESGPAGD